MQFDRLASLGFIRTDRRPEDSTTVDEVIALFRKQGRAAAPANAA